ncbi:MAG: hypothetical protein OWT27_00305 [Firmicutes bacterium]|nr:hypothetical protein [Bacillota bacterium]
MTVHVVRRPSRRILIGAATALAVCSLLPLHQAAAARAVPPLQSGGRAQLLSLHTSRTGAITEADGTWTLPLKRGQTLHYVRDGLSLIWYVSTRDDPQSQTLRIWRTELTLPAIHGDLRSAAQLLGQIPVKGMLLSTRAEFGRGVLLLGVRSSTATTWYTVTRRAELHLFELHGAETVRALLWGEGMVIVLRSARMWPGRIAQAVYVSRGEATVTTLPVTSWPLVATDSAISPMLVSGRTALVIGVHGHIVKTAAPPLALVNTPAASAKIPAVVPSAAAAVLLTQPVQLRNLAHGGYELRLRLTQLPAICASVQPLATSDRRRGARPTHAAHTAYLAWFGATRALHSFVLGSSAGPTVTWILAEVPHQVGGIWIAEFSVHGFRYLLGPFSTPANRAQTALLERVLQRAAITSPRSSAEGTVDIALSTLRDGSPYLRNSQVVLAPEFGSRITLSSSGIAAVDYASIWTFS